MTNTLGRLVDLQSTRLLQLVAECKRLAGLAGIRDYSVPGLDAPPAVVTERWRAEMPVVMHTAGGDICWADDAKGVVTQANAELDAAETRERELREALDEALGAVAVGDGRIVALEARIRELTEWRPASATPKDGTIIVAELVNGGFEVLELANPAPDEEWTRSGCEHGPFYGPEEIRRFVSLPGPLSFFTCASCLQNKPNAEGGTPDAIDVNGDLCDECYASKLPLPSTEGGDG